MDGTEFYKENQFHFLRSAKEVVPLIIEILRPNSVIDIGCGIGTWLSVFREHGVEDVFGVDSDYVYRKMLQIPEDRFLGFDLRKPLRLDREFDLALSLEVAEHLPRECAETFVDSLTRLAPAILFCAAIPYQGGEHHLNEQWPDYWASFFRKRDYMVIDCIRRKIWENDAVDWWYAQNILLFVSRSYVEDHPFLKSLSDSSRSGLAVVHPKKYASLISALETAYAAEQAAADPRNMSLRQVLHIVPTLLLRSLKRRAKVSSRRRLPGLRLAPARQAADSFVVNQTDLNVECRTPGISGFMRIRDEEDFLALAIESHLPFLDELVVVHNRCTDRSPAIAEDYRRRYPEKIRVYHYEPFVYVNASDEYVRLPPDSPHSLVNYYNYALCKTTRQIALKVDGDHIAIPAKFDKLMRLIRGRWIDRLLFRKRFNCYLTFRGLNLWDKDGKIYVNALDPMTSGLDCGFFPVTRETWYTHDPRFEVLHVGSLRRSAFPEICFYHTKMMKKDRGMANCDLDNSFILEIIRGRHFIPQLVPFEEYCAKEKAAKGLPSPAALGIKPLWTR